MNRQLEWNETAADGTRHLTVLDLFADNVRTRPQSVALRDDQKTSWTYRDLDDWSAATAGLLRSAGVRTGDRVALIVDRTAVGCALLLATVRAGAQYVPLDPRWPRARLAALVDQLGIVHIACDQSALPVADAVRWSSERKIEVICPESRPETEPVSDAVIDLFDELALDDDDLAANGFVVRGDEDFTVADMDGYHSRVRDLIAPLAHDGPVRLADLGCGPGTLTARLKDLASSVVCVDPSYECVKRTTDALTDAGTKAIGEVSNIVDIDPVVLSDRDVALLASVVQFLPDLETFVDAITHIASAMTYDDSPRSIVLADLVPPGAGNDALLCIPRALVESLTDLVPEVAEVHIHERAEGHHLLQQRYDAVLRLGAPAPCTATLVHREAETGGAAPWSPPSPEHLAYAIFTSGTTGTPKAVQVDHRALTGLVDWMRDGQGIDADDVVLFTTAYSFDLSVFDTLGMWAIGGTVRIASQDELAEPADLVDVLAEEDITLWDSAPAALQMLLPFLELHDGPVSTTLRRVMLSGDWVPLTIREQIREPFPNADVLALGGATECTVWSNSHLVEELDPAWPSVPYGVPMPNSRYYVVDENADLAAPGQEGDLYIAGACLAVDYAHTPALTASKFKPDPYATARGERMYATGDRAVWLPEGLVQFRGRRNDQVKLRGYRIELREIQANAVAAGVTDAVAIMYQVSGENALALFYVDRIMSSESLRNALEQLLPAYMVPVTIRRVDRIPTTTNGKADREALRGMIDA